MTPDHQAGQILRRNRLECGLTQLDVAEALQVTRRAVKHWEGGSRRPVRRSLALLTLLEVSIQDVIALKRLWAGLTESRTPEERAADTIGMWDPSGQAEAR
jgi:transcriptional regulator with XRE-family HTH domain